LFLARLLIAAKARTKASRSLVVELPNLLKWGRKEGRKEEESLIDKGSSYIGKVCPEFRARLKLKQRLLRSKDGSGLW
jgi:hypothetical protein